MATAEIEFEATASELAVEVSRLEQRLDDIVSDIGAATKDLEHARQALIAGTGGTQDVSEALQRVDILESTRATIDDMLAAAHRRLTARRAIELHAAQIAQLRELGAEVVQNLEDYEAGLKALAQEMNRLIQPVMARYESAVVAKRKFVAAACEVAPGFKWTADYTNKYYDHPERGPDARRAQELGDELRAVIDGFELLARPLVGCPDCTIDHVPLKFAPFSLKQPALALEEKISGQLRSNIEADMKNRLVKSPPVLSLYEIEKARRESEKR